MMSILIDIILAILMVYFAFQCLLAPRLIQTVFLFFAFGLALTLAWVRLRAVDVAIAEAAIAAGFLGVLLFDALRDFSRTTSRKPKNPEPSQNLPARNEPRYLLMHRLALGLGLVFFLLISFEAIWNIPAGGGLTAESAAMLPKSGVEHPVTAVLMNYRAYDTWMEIGVILMGLLAIFATGGMGLSFKPMAATKDPLLRQVILIFTPVLFMFGAFILYYGKTGPGGAFQAGVLWGANGILLHLGGWPVLTLLPQWLRQLLLTIGLAFFLVLGFILMAAGNAFFEYPHAYAGIMILLAETMAAISIAAALTAIFAYLNQMKEQSNQIEPHA